MREPARPRLNSGAAPDGRAAPTVTSLATQKALDRGQDWLPTRSVSTPSRIDAAQAIHTLMLYVLSLRARQRSEASWNHSPPASRVELGTRKHLPKCRRYPTS